MKRKVLDGNGKPVSPKRAARQPRQRERRMRLDRKGKMGVTSGADKHQAGLRQF